MAERTEPTAPESAETAGSSLQVSSILFSPLVWGGLLTVGFYAAVPYLPVQQELVRRYFCSHPLEYATAALFFVGVATIGLKALGLRSERSAFGDDPLAGHEFSGPGNFGDRLVAFEARLEALPPAARRTHLGRRLRDVAAYLRGRQSSEGLEEHLKYLAELAAERLHASYALVRTITWAVPILGFLGTVIGITLAIANLQPEQLQSSLGEVTGGLAVAFDTTALALALSLVLVFGSFVVERSEQRILGQVEEYGISRIACAFPSRPQDVHPLADAEAQAARQLIERTESLIGWQTQLWQEQLESLRERWTESLDTQRHRLDESLQQGMSRTLADHAGMLESVRDEFLGEFRSVSREFSEGMSEAAAAQKNLQDEFGRRVSDLWQTIEADLQEHRRHREESLARLLDGVGEKVDGWHERLRESNEIATSQTAELRKQSEVMLEVVAQEEQLARLQERLTQNLESIRAAETFDESLHALTAAIHMLTARSKPKAA